MKLIYQFCQKIRVFESLTQFKKMKTKENYLIFNSKSIFFSRSFRFDVASCSNIACFLKHFEIFVNVDDKICSTLINL